jgi:hypothetical protein
MKLFIFLYSLIFYALFPAVIYAKDPQTIEWDQLMPPGYVESILEQNKTENSQTQDFFEWDDDTDQTQAAYDELKAKLSSAPIVPELNNQYIRLAGFIVPLNFDFDTETYSEFLLVPYFGACIHVPPPPSNQVVYVTANKPLKETTLDYAVWASGILTTKSASSEYAFAGYTMNDVEIEEYKE